MKSELLGVLNHVQSALSLLVALALLLVGILMVRPAHATAGMVLAAGAGVRLASILLNIVVGFARSGISGDAVLGMIAISSLLGTLGGLALWGSVLVAANMLAGELLRRGGRAS
jgi:hypothetical protein